MSLEINRNKSLTNNRYRLEIDGLRAFAVVAVIINHSNKEILPNGYLGVDIFFVISGFVITSSFYQRPSKNFKDFISRFYERRIKRLVPALSVFVLIMSIAICLFNPEPTLSLRTGLTSLFGLSNLYLLKQSTDYFAQSTELNVFTHTWSLGVEEQFYILFPFLIWFSGFGRQTKNGARNLFLIVGALAIASLIGFIYLYPINQSAAYFLMPTRFWEMASGCLLFIGFEKIKFIEQFLEKLPPLLLLILIIGVMYLPISLSTISTFAVVVLSLVLIASLKKGTAAYTIFTNSKVVYIGLISYSLYLWHWGILSISRWTVGIHWWSLPFQVALILSLAIVSYRYIETPLRKGNWFGKQWKTIVVGGGVLITISGGLIKLEKSHKKSFYLGEESKKEELPYAGKSITRKNCMDHSDFKKAMRECWLNKKNEATSSQRIFFVGDSHTESMSQSADYLSKKISDPIFIHSRRGTIFPIVAKDLIKSVGENRQSSKSLKNNLIQSVAENYLISNIKRGDIVIISIRFPYHFGLEDSSNKKLGGSYLDKDNNIVSMKDFFNKWKKAVSDFANNLESKNAKLIISSPTPEWNNFNIQSCGPIQWFNKLSKNNCIEEKIFFDRKYESIITFLERLEQQNKNVYILNSLSALCSNGICEYRQNDEALYRDKDHLSNYASRNIIGPILVDLINEIRH